MSALANLGMCRHECFLLGNIMLFALHASFTFNKLLAYLCHIEPRVHFMHLGSKISSVAIALIMFLGIHSGMDVAYVILLGVLA